MGSHPIKILKDLITNFKIKESKSLFYIAENTDWIINRMGQDITENIKSLQLLQAHTTTTTWGLKKQIIHFGSLPTFFAQKKIGKPHPSNKIIVSCFHLIPHDLTLKKLRKAAAYIDFFHTSCHSTKEELLKLGVPASRIVTIPLGINLHLFRPISTSQKPKLRKALGLPQKQLIIGSFQKDGIGWGQGLKPKLIKGPDIFLQVANALKKYKPFILLTGPSRGYVKQGLKKANIPYAHFYLKNYVDLRRMYNALDLYLITSRLEGGPASLLEAWASGIPTISTTVGMVPDITENEKNILLAAPGNVSKIVNQIEKIMKNKNLQTIIVKNAIAEVQKYSWENIVKRYYQELYAKLI